MEDDNETEKIIIAKNINELSIITSNLLNEIGLGNQQIDDLDINKNKTNENEIFYEHFENYIKFNPIKAITFRDINLEWFNVTEPISIEDDLLSHIVVLDFFTYCCINCLHILPDLEALEEKYKPHNSPVTVIGIHSGKFSNERKTKNVFDAINKYHITHPVANDINCKLWTTLGISCWPTLVVLGPGGLPLFVLMGEGNRDTLFRLVDESVKYFSTNRSLKHRTLPLKPLHYLPSKDNDLYYPGKVECYCHGLIISDSGNNRIILTNYYGHVKMIIGSCRRGYKDGSFEDATFNNPQGVVFLAPNFIYVADTDNHVIRKIDLSSKAVGTVAGTGKQGSDLEGGNYKTEQAISSPWGLCLAHSLDLVPSESPPNLLLIAMSGCHQIWGLFLSDGRWLKNRFYKEGTVVCLAGSGLEENRNTSYPLKAGFAQPSGICLAYTSGNPGGSANLGQIHYKVGSNATTTSHLPPLMDNNTTSGGQSPALQIPHLTDSNITSGGEIPPLMNNKATFGGQPPHLTDNKIISGGEIPPLMDINATFGGQPPHLTDNNITSGGEIPPLMDINATFGGQPPHLTDNDIISGGEIPPLMGSNATFGRQTPHLTDNNITSIGQVAFIADSESSTIRQFSLIDGSVKKVVGGGLDPRDLFAYGDVNGTGGEVKLQHPLAVACRDVNTIYVADSYNHKLKVIERKDKKFHIRTLLGVEDDSQIENYQDDMLKEPGGICYNEERNSIFISDTNNSCIKEYSLEERKIKKININFDSYQRTNDVTDHNTDDTSTIYLPHSYNDLILKLRLFLSANLHLTPEMTQTYQVIIPEGGQVICSNSEGYFEEDLTAQISIKIQNLQSECSIFVKCLLYLCLDQQGMCIMKRVSKKFIFVKKDDADAKLTITLDINPDI